MTKKRTTIFLSEHTQRQITTVKQLSGLTQTEIIAFAIDRFVQDYRRELEIHNAPVAIVVPKIKD
jgi:hypothetical protein